jgi:hypothetical protein
MNYKIFYMTNVKTSNKTKLPGANKIRCLNNFVNLFENNLIDNIEISILLDDDGLFNTGEVPFPFTSEFYSWRKEIYKKISMKYAI